MPVFSLDPDQNKLYKVYSYFFNKLSLMSKQVSNRKMGPPSSAFYGLGFIGALIYYIVHATGFWIGVLGFLKACVWPAFLIYELMEFLKM